MAAALAELLGFSGSKEISSCSKNVKILLWLTSAALSIRELWRVSGCVLVLELLSDTPRSAAEQILGASMGDRAVPGFTEGRDSGLSLEELRKEPVPLFEQPLCQGKFLPS